MALKIIDNINKFVMAHAGAMDIALNRMAIDIERLAKVRVPLDKGQLKASGRHIKMGPLHFRTEFNKEYAGYQEFGQRKDGSHKVRKYTTPGTGKFYLKNSGDEIKKNAFAYVKAEADRIKV